LLTIMLLTWTDPVWMVSLTGRMGLVVQLGSTGFDE